MLVGLVCPEDGKNKRLEECLVNRSCVGCLPFSVRYAMIKDWKHKEIEGVHVTSILNCLKKIFLERSQDFYDDPSRLYYAFRGRIIHGVLSLIDLPEVKTEIELSKRIDSVEVRGTIDYYDYSSKILIDYKTVHEFALKHIEQEGLKAEHKDQVNIYRWLLYPLPVEFAYIYYMTMSQVKVYEVGLSPLSTVESFVKDRALVLSKAIKQKKAPPANPGWICKYCAFRGVVCSDYAK